MIRLIFCVGFLICAARASGDFVVLHSPDSVLFKDEKEIEQSLLKEVFTAALGFTVKLRSNWNGISLQNPISLPEAVVGIVVEGVDSLDFPPGKHYSLIMDESEETTWQALSGRIMERDNDNMLVRIYLGDGLDALGHSALGELKPTALEKLPTNLIRDRDEDKKFLEEVELLHAIAKKIPSTIKRDLKPDVFWLVVSGLRPVHDVHGKVSVPAREALSLLNNAINDIKEAFIEAYNGQVLITAFTNNASEIRETRSVHLERQIRAAGEGATLNETNVKLVETTTERIEEEQEYQEVKKIIESSQMNLSKEYNSNYPVIFNIILWFCIIFFFSLYAVCITIAQMDPGRDSIIYRMTSNRMKKEN